MNQKDDNKPINLKLIVIGDANSGKTALIRRYCQNFFSEKYAVLIFFPFDNSDLEFNRA